MKTATYQKAKLSKDLNRNFSFSVAKISLLTFEKKHKLFFFFSKVNQKIWQLKKIKNQNHLNLWRIAQLLMRGFFMRIFHYYFKKIKNKKNKKI